MLKLEEVDHEEEVLDEEGGEVVEALVGGAKDQLDEDEDVVEGSDPLRGGR